MSSLPQTKNQKVIGTQDNESTNSNAVHPVVVEAFLFMSGSDRKNKDISKVSGGTTTQRLTTLASMRERHVLFHRNISRLVNLQ